MATQQTTKAASAAKTATATTLAEAAAAKLAELNVEATHPDIDDQNRIDVNDPTIDGREAVARNLAAQAK